MENKDKHEFTCIGGPLDGQSIWLSIEHPYTLTFKLRNAHGRYTSTRSKAGKLHWESMRYETV